MSSNSYTLHYWPTIPGRGEYVRLAFEATGTPYKEETDVKSLQEHVMSIEKVGSPPHFAPPILEVNVSSIDSTAEGNKPKALKVEEGQSAGSAISGGNEQVFFLSQTPNILAYLGSKLGLIGDKNDDSEIKREIRRAHVNQMVLTILDLSNEIHDVHHPIATSLTKEEQGAECLRKAPLFRNLRIPKFLSYFQLILSNNTSNSGYLAGGRLTIADLTLFQVLEGIAFAFPRLYVSLEKCGRYDSVFGLRKLVENHEGTNKYLKSGRRQSFSMGIFRFYEELDGEVEFQD